MSTSDAGKATRILILGGTAEAVALAKICAARSGVDVVSSLAGRTRTPTLPPGEVRVGGFGGAEGLARFLIERSIDRLIDATHPFAVRIGAHAEKACRRTEVARLRLLRPPWRRERDDRWIEVGNFAEAAQALPGLGRCAFLTVGHGDLEAFAGLDLWFLVRTIEPPTTPLPLIRARWLAGRGPFAVEDELKLFRAHGIDVLVTKASGGDATYPKLVAARRLGLPVVMIRRPPPPPGPVVGSAEAALAWLDRPV